MTLTPLELLRLRAADGIASDDERARLVAAGLDPDGWAPVREAVASSLLHGAGLVPELADAVLAELGVADDSSVAVRAVLAADSTPDLADAVLAELGIDQAGTTVTGVLRQAHDAGGAPELAHAVMAELGLAAADSTVGDVLRAAAGPAPSLWEGIARALGLPVGSDVPGDDEVIDITAHPRFRTWSVPAVGLAAAAAMLLFFSGAPTSTPSDRLVFELSPVNRVDIEDLSVDDGAMVQVLQFDEDAPPIIFVNMLEEGLEPTEDDWGAPL